MVQRRVVCDVPCSPSETMRRIFVCRTSRGMKVSSSASAPMMTSDTRPRKAPLALRKIATATIGRNSPTAPEAMMNAPNRPSSIRLSRRIGSRVPSAVVVRPIAIGTNALTRPAAAKAAVTPTATTSVTNQDDKASRPARSRNRPSSSS